MRIAHHLFLIAAFCVGCGGEPARTRSTEHRPPPDAKQDGGDYPGRLDASDVRRIIEQHKGGFNNCFRHARASYLSGEVYVEFAVGATGRVEDASVTRSDLGSWVVEDCLVGVARFMEFPRPAGGRARFAYPFGRTAQGTRSRARVKQADRTWGYGTIRGARRAINTCRRRYGYRGPFHVTTYVGSMGTVLDVGFDAKEPVATEFPACIVQTIRRLKFPAPRTGQTIKYRALVENLDDDA